jgi:hypothetical protein
MRHTVPCKHHINKEKTNMSPTTIVTGINQIIQTKLLVVMSKKWRPQFSFGIRAYGLRAFQSATSNARQVIGNTNTAARKSERLLANINLASRLGAAFDALSIIKPKSYVNCDHSDMNGLSAFVGAVQTHKGRALPCLVEVTYSDRLPATTNAFRRKQHLRQARASERRQVSFTDHYIKALQTLHDRLGFWPKLVFDRGFSNQSLVTYLQAAGAIFYVRLKAGRYVSVIDPDTNTPTRVMVKQLVSQDAVIGLYGLRLRIIRSPRSRRAKEPWYILTNDTVSSRDKIVHIYYHRFEIEETFRDIKHIFELKRTRLNKPNSMKVILWLVSLGVALLYIVTRPTKQSLDGYHSKKQLSWLRHAYERLQQDVDRVLWGGG